jgi:hypothetical protein
MGVPRIFRKLGGQATRLFSKIRDNPSGILKKVSEVSDVVGKGMNAAAPIVGTIGMATGQPEIVALGAGLKAGAIGANKLSDVTEKASIATDKNANALERAKAGGQIVRQVYY